MRLLFLTGSRGEWGYIRPILKLCIDAGVDYNVCATNMHLLPSHGLSVEEIESDGFEVSDKVYMSIEGGNHHTMTKSMGVLLSSLVDIYARIQPDWIVLAGDRGEQLIGAIAGAYTYVPIAHIQAGERSGNIDGSARHAIGKLVHLHFASNQDAADRLRSFGEEEFRIHNVGAPQLDELVAAEFTSPDELKSKLGLDTDNGFLLVVQHPVTEEYDQAAEQIAATVEAVSNIPMQKLWVLPNNDAGGVLVREGILRNRDSNTLLFDNLPRQDYLGLLRQCSAIVGNSSSGILEAPTFRTPTVNIGNRQKDRIQGQNVINCDHNPEEIKSAIAKATSDEFKAEIAGSENPYGDGQSSARILGILRDTPINSQLLSKRVTI